MEIQNLDLPQLIVALDSPNEDANYIHIRDAKENTDYYCPCCKGLIKPRAYKKDEKYKMQPHFYHISGGCTEETYIHYICKNFLFETGSKFIVNMIEYEAAKVFIEKEYTTKFGVYIPDITVITTSNKIFYFEIKNTSKKTTDYIPKWDELGNDVVEVDIKQFVNKKFERDTIVFKLIYSDGNCYIRKYVHRNYEEIERRKLEWKRQDKINYKIQWERLDWFWEELQEYSLSKNSEGKVIKKFSLLDFKDMEFGIKAIKNHKFFILLNKCIKINNLEFEKQIEYLGIKIEHNSVMIHDITFPKENHYGVEYFPTAIYRKKMEVCDYSCLCNILNMQKEAIQEKKIYIEEKINELNEKLVEFGLSGIVYKDTSWKYYDQKYNYFIERLEYVENHREFYKYKKEYENRLSEFKNYVNKHKGWFLDYEFNTSSYLRYVRLEIVITFNKRNKEKININIDGHITVNNIIDKIKKQLEYPMRKMIKLDGFIRKNWWTEKIYCEKDRLMIVDKKENN